MVLKDKKNQKWMLQYESRIQQFFFSLLKASNPNSRLNFIFFLPSWIPTTVNENKSPVLQK